MGQTGDKGRHSEDIFALKVFVIGPDFLDAHATGEPFEYVFDRVAQATDAGLAVADSGIEGDAINSAMQKASVAAGEFDVGADR